MTEMKSVEQIASEMLTEQWEKGELPDGWYYIEGNRVEGIYAYTAEYLNNMYRPRNGERIVARVPSCEELQNINKSVNDLMASNIELVEENKQLKELLKECVELMGDGTTYMHIDVYRQRKKDVLNAISQALGEDK